MNITPAKKIGRFKNIDANMDFDQYPRQLNMFKGVNSTKIIDINSK